MMKKTILMLLVCIPIELIAPANPTKTDTRLNEITILRNSELTLKNVKRYIKLMKIQYFEIVTSQYILETGWGKSNICKTCNNLFGFRNKNGYFQYKHWTESIEAYKRFQDRKYKEGCYYTFLEKVGYSESNKYIKTLKLIKI
jgi:hypothetical protein